MRLWIKFAGLFLLAVFVHLSLLDGRFALIGILTGEDQVFVRGIVGQMEQKQVTQYWDVDEEDPHPTCSAAAAAAHAEDFRTDSIGESSSRMRPSASP